MDRKSHMLFSIACNPCPNLNFGHGWVISPQSIMWTCFLIHALNSTLVQLTSVCKRGPWYHSCQLEKSEIELRAVSRRQFIFLPSVEWLPWLQGSCRPAWGRQDPGEPHVGPRETCYLGICEHHLYGFISIFTVYHMIIRKITFH